MTNRWDVISVSLKRPGRNSLSRRSAHKDGRQHWISSARCNGGAFTKTSWPPGWRFQDIPSHDSEQKQRTKVWSLLSLVSFAYDYDSACFFRLSLKRHLEIDLISCSSLARGDWIHALQLMETTRATGTKTWSKKKINLSKCIVGILRMYVYIYIYNIYIYIYYVYVHAIDVEMVVRW